MDRSIAAWENEGGAPQSVERKLARRFAGTIPLWSASCMSWDIARTVQGGKPEPVAPTYVVASLPGEDRRNSC
jgi:hypothetical protein